MLRCVSVAILLGVGSGVWGCAAPKEDTRIDEVVGRAAFLFSHYSEAQKRQDGQLLGLVRGDLLRLNIESYDVLLEALSSKNAENQGYAVFALGFSAQHSAIEPVAALTAHPDEAVRCNAIAALGELGFPDCPMEPFRRLFKDPFPEVRQGALYGIAFLVSPKDDLGMLAPIHQMLQDSEKSVRTEALLAIRKMRRKESVVVILATVIRDPDPQVRAAAALALGGIGKEAKEATPFLIELLKDDFHKVVEAAWTALNKINEKDLDRSYSTWRDWFEDEQKVHFTCPQHREVSELSPGLCPKCKLPLERTLREGIRPTGPPPPGAMVPMLFVCPDHPEVVTTSPARCGHPGCGKELVPKKPAPLLYTCPDHPEIVTTTPAKCGKPGCGKDLVPQR